MDDTVRKENSKRPIVPVPDQTYSYDKISSEEIYNKKLKAEEEVKLRAQMCEKATDAFFSEDNNSKLQNIDTKVLTNRIQYIFKNTLHLTGEAKILKYVTKLLERRSKLVDPDEVFNNLQNFEACRDLRSSQFLNQVLSSIENIQSEKKQMQELKGLYLYSLKRILGQDFRGLNLKYITQQLKGMSEVNLIDKEVRQKLESIDGGINDELIIFKEQYHQEVTNLKKVEELLRHFSANKNFRDELDKLITRELEKIEAQLGMN